MNEEGICCPQFDPDPWNEKEIIWQDKTFLQDHVCCLFHIPLNFGQVMTRMMSKIEAAKVKCQDVIILADENSLWGTEEIMSFWSPGWIERLTSDRITRDS